MRQQRLGREQPRPRRRQLDRQRQPVEPPADLGHRRRRWRQPSARSARIARARSTKRLARGDPRSVLRGASGAGSGSGPTSSSCSPWRRERHAARRQHLHRGHAPATTRDSSGAASRDVLEVVEDEQRLLAARCVISSRRGRGRPSRAPRAPAAIAGRPARRRRAARARRGRRRPEGVEQASRPRGAPDASSRCRRGRSA